jgi:hypothetical protein
MNVYRKRVSGTNQYDYTFAFRGTVGSLSDPGWQNNITQVWANNSRGQIQSAERLVDGVIRSNLGRVRNVYFTGHSLGGYLSQWMQARIHDGNGPTGVSGRNGTQATTFNAPGFARSLEDNRPGYSTPLTAHQREVNRKIANRANYNRITNYQITRQNGNAVIDPVAIQGLNLGTTAHARSVNSYKNVFHYHALSEFFDILRHRSSIVR